MILHADHSPHGAPVGFEALTDAAWILLVSLQEHALPVKSFSLRLVAIVWLLAALSLVGWLIVNLDAAGWILVAVTTGLMTFELTRKPVRRRGPTTSPGSSAAHQEPPD